MFGYIKVQKENLLVKDWALYRAVYCGLCREIRKNVSFFLPFSLSYDFVFLAIVRDIALGEKITFTKGRCPYNPFKKREFVESEGIKFASRASAVLAEKNVSDKLVDKDTKIPRAFLKIVLKYLKRKIKKLDDASILDLSETVSKGLGEFDNAEKQKALCDELALKFGKVLGSVFAFGFSDEKQRILFELGKSAGAWIYFADAIDDAEKDFENNRFNPLLKEYKTPEKIRENVQKIDVSFASHAKDAHLALSMLPHHRFTSIAENVVSEGLGAEAFRIMTNNGGKNDRSI